MMIIKAHFSVLPGFDSIEEEITNLLNNHKSNSKTKWDSVFSNLSKFDKFRLKGAKYSYTELCKFEIMLNVLYPRLDINVSKHINHLLKSPFCVHPGTGLISVPLSENDIINFDLNEIPSITETIDDFMNNRYKFF